MENFTYQALQAYNHWYPPTRVALHAFGTLSCGHKGLIGAPMCKKCADVLIAQSRLDGDRYGQLLDDLVVAYVNQNGTMLIAESLPSFAVDYLNHLGNTNHSEGTVAVYAGVLWLFFAYICPNPEHYTIEELSKLKLHNIEAFLSHCRLKRENGPASLAHKQSVIKSLYHYLMRAELLAVDVTDKLDSINVQEKLPKVLHPDDVTRLTEELETGNGYKWTRDRDRAIIFTLIGTGLRVSELCNLNMADVDFVHGILRIIHKGGGEATVPFGEDVEQALRAYIDHERARYESKRHSLALFLSIRGTRLSVDAVQVLVTNALESIGIPGVTTQKLRSTAAMQLLRETGNIALVQNFLRLKDPNATIRYTTVMQDELRRAANKIHVK